MKHISGLNGKYELRKISVLFITFLFFYGCSFGSVYAKDDEDKAREYSKIEIMLSDFSKKITAYYAKQNISIPKDFDEKQFFEILQIVYPDQTKVELIKKNFKIKAYSKDNIYSVVLCDPDRENKLMEDLSCTLNKVDLRFWDKDGAYSCTFEEDWERYCK